MKANLTPAPSDCRVAALADEAGAIIAGLDNTRPGGERPDGLSNDYVRSLLHDRLHAIEALALLRPAASLKGAAFQTLLLIDVVENLEHEGYSKELPGVRATAEGWRRTGTSAVRSILAAMDAHGAGLPASIVAYYVSENEHQLVSEAIAGAN